MRFKLPLSSSQEAGRVVALQEGSKKRKKDKEGLKSKLNPPSTDNSLNHGVCAIWESRAVFPDRAMHKSKVLKQNKYYWVVKGQMDRYKIGEVSFKKLKTWSLNSRTQIFTKIPGKVAVFYPRPSYQGLCTSHPLPGCLWCLGCHPEKKKKIR